MNKDIPLLDSADAAELEECFIRSAVEKMILRFPRGATDLPENSQVLVSVTRDAEPGDAVVVATRSGNAVTGFYRRHDSDIIIESLNHRERLRFPAHERKKIIRWMFPVLLVDTICISPLLSLRSHAEKNNDS